MIQWKGVINNNTQTTVGSWAISATNYSNARFFGDDLMLPGAGGKNYYDGSLCDYDGNYWSSTDYTSSSAWGMSVYSNYADTGHNYRGYGASVRCVADSDPFLSTGMYPATDGSGYSDFHEFKLDEGGYLDITKFKSTVGLYDQSLAVINSDLASDDYIPAGEYKLKFTYQPTSLIPGNVTIFSLELIEYSDLPSIESKKYNAVGSFGSYSEYYKLDMGVGGYVDVTTTKAAVYVYNKTIFENDGMPLTSHYENIIGNTYLDGGEYIVKLTYSATSLTPGTVSFMAN